MSTENKLFPLMLDLSGKRIIIVGAGKVAIRKAKSFLDYADVTMINSYFSKNLRSLSTENRISLVKENPEQLTDKQWTALISSAFLVITATSDKQLNQRITKIAKRYDVLTNEVDAVGEVVIPSIVSHGDLTIGISTNGTSPALSKYTRKKIEQFITPSYASMACLQKEMREYYKLTISDQEQRKKLLWMLLENEDVWAALSNSYEQALKIAQQIKTDD